MAARLVPCAEPQRRLFARRGPEECVIPEGAGIARQIILLASKFSHVLGNCHIGQLNVHLMAIEPALRLKTVCNSFDPLPMVKGAPGPYVD